MPLYITPDLITLNYLRLHRRLATNETDDDTLLTTFIKEASSDFADDGLMRTPHPYLATFSFDYSNPRLIELDEDLLALTTLTNGDGTVIPSTEYVLEPANSYPKRKVLMKYGSSYVFNYNTSPEQAISIAGIWGYVPHYPTCFKSYTTLAAAITATTATTFTVASATGIEVGHYVQVDSEQMQVTVINAVTLTVIRGVNGTTAATHLVNAVLGVFQQAPDIMGAVRALAAYKYLTKDQIGSRVSVIDNGVVQVQDLDPQVQKTITRHKRFVMFKAV